MTMLRPGQLTPNDLESAIIQRLAEKTAELIPLIKQLHVLSREYTGVGGYTRFQPQATGIGHLADRQLGLEGLILLPSVPNGMGAVLHCENGSPNLLELFTYGDDHWDGLIDDFKIETSC